MESNRRQTASGDIDVQLALILLGAVTLVVIFKTLNLKIFSIFFFKMVVNSASRLTVKNAIRIVQPRARRLA